MVVNIFDPGHIEIMSKKRLLGWFFDNFPYKTEDFNGITFEKFPENDDVAGLFVDLASLALMMIDKNEENEEIRKIKSRFKDMIPFKSSDNEASFAELDKYDYSAMFFPIETGANPEWGLCVRSSNGGTFFFDSKDCVWKRGWSGTDGSYRLAEALAARLLEPEMREHVYEAAKNWIVTGDAGKNGNIKKVGLGRKLTLKTKKKFVIPQENIGSLSDEEKMLDMFSVDTVETAVNLISKKGVKPIVDREFPEEVDELHILVGAALSPQIASIVLVNAKKIVLWHSETSEVNADEICEIAEKYRGITPEKQKLSSSSLLEAEASLKRYFNSRDISSGTRIIFNFTSGNRLMATAVQSIARLYHNVEMIYRDINGDDKGREKEDASLIIFNLLQYSEFPPLYGKIYGRVKEGLDVDFLRNGIRIGSKGNDGPKKTYQDGQDFYDKLIKREE